jgi:hypothetical protein
MTGVPLDVLFTRLGLVLATGTVLVATSLLAYLFVYNFRDPVARAFVLLLGFADFVYVGDVFLSTAQLPASHPAAAFWLRFEWVGIAFVVPALLHFGDSLLLATGHRSAARRNGLIAAYVAGAVVLFAVLGSSALVGPVVGQRGSVYLERGPLFPLFAVLFLVGTAMACSWVWRARQRTLTSWPLPPP